MIVVRWFILRSCYFSLAAKKIIIINMFNVVPCCPFGDTIKGNLVNI